MTIQNQTLLNTQTTEPIGEEFGIDEDLIGTLGIMAVAAVVIVMLSRMARKAKDSSDRHAPLDSTSNNDDFSELGDSGGD